MLCLDLCLLENVFYPQFKSTKGIQSPQDLEFERRISNYCDKRLVGIFVG